MHRGRTSFGPPGARLERLPGEFSGQRRAGAAVLAAALAAAALVLAPAPRAEALVDIRPVRTVQFGDGEVRATAQIGNRIYVGGNFRRVGPLRTGSAGLADPITGSFADHPFPTIDGPVNAAIPDGAGGWYVGGDFETVGGLYRQNVARVLADGSVSDFKPKTDGPVNALALSIEEDALYVGGSFTSAKGVPVANLAKVSLTTADLLPWSGTTDGAVRVLALDGTRLYVGGAFTSIAGTFRPNLAALDKTTGSLDLNFNPGTVNGEVRTLLRAPDGASWYVGGSFTTIGGFTRSRVAQLTTTGPALSFNPGADNTVNTLALSPSGVLYVGGAFRVFRSTTRARLAGITLATGALTPLVFPMEAGTVDSLLVSPDGATLYVGGTYDIRNSAPPNPVRIMAVDLATNAWKSFNPALFEPSQGRVGVRVLVLDAGRLFIGGDFGAYDGVEKPYLVAIDATTGELDPTFNPRPDKPVHALIAAPDGSALYAGGLFTLMGGKGAKRLAQLDPVTGLRSAAFTPRVDAEVMKLAIHGSTLYVGGRFTSAGNAPRSRLAALDAITGQATPFNLPANAAVRSLDLTPDGSQLFIAGQFSTVGGVQREGVAAIDTTTGTLTPWAPLTYRFQRYLRDVDVSPDGTAVYFVSSGGDIPPSNDTAVKFPTAGTGNVAPLWVNRVKDTIEAVAVSDDAVYIGGHFRWVDNGAQTRFHIAALDPATGVGLDWDPTAGGFRGVLELTIGPAGLMAGNDGTHVGKAPSARFGLLPFVAAGGTP